MDNDKIQKTCTGRPLGDAINALVQGIEKLKQESASYVDIWAKETELEEKQKELTAHELDLARRERDMRRHPEKYIFPGIASLLWAVSTHDVEPPAEAKCTECDEYGYRHYTSPNGVPVKELCHCRWIRQEFIACEARLSEIRLHADEKPVLFYRPENDDYSSIVLDKDEHYIYDGQQPFVELNRFRVLFQDEKTAKKYAEWLNMYEKPYYYNRYIRYEDQ